MKDFAATGLDGTALSVDGVPVVSFADAVSRLCADFPQLSPARIEALLIREWEAFCAGRPLVIPTAVEEGAREMLSGPA
ncbi:MULTISPECIES: hypothetical protein [unclassified Microbacterium]|uniref:hypothetical protein n=1 Tax=unclassified Microbacterium TaxID=2609290 RepID=UPI00214ADCC4|nr:MULTISPECIES: hypothetical protein [unclassified Microbacterium]MCR2784839.1 hypothetical protein [Microbacterium sp. zg.B96]MDL5352708.1 hypothetical protein [Microbacterium sp. zg-YB36]WIM16377.1 hypothetical protein QNO11_01720 [Microbacterium sp. zg-B96]